MPDIATLPRRRHTEVLFEKVEPDRKAVLDVGCGDGALVRALAEAGALAVGLEVSAAQLAKARAAGPVPGADYLAGQGENLPFPDDGLDVVVFFNSLHHVPLGKMDLALDEAVRVLKSGGLLYVAEPLAEGPNFEVSRHFDDETEVRAAAYRALERAGAADGLQQLGEEFYLTTSAYPNFAAYREQMLRVDPARERSFREQAAVIEEEFERLAERDGKGRFRLDQPMRVNWLRRL
jgi:ubiquinone/menaquinone biosynthesis C-methylase UbiE